MAAIFVNFIVKHHVFELVNALYFMKTLKITRMLVSRITAATKLLKICLSNRLIDDEIFKRLKTMPSHAFCLHISGNGDVINGDIIKTQC